MRTQRFIWNFELMGSVLTIPDDIYQTHDKEELKWEARFFWPAQEVIIIYPIEKDMFDFAKYAYKIRDDQYYLIPKQEYNIKQRQDNLYYKPLIKSLGNSSGFAPKINLTAQESLSPDLKKIIQLVQHEAQLIPVKKQAFIYSLATIPKIKLELARLEINETIYFSLCIEGKSFALVNRLSTLLVQKKEACDYVPFLKRLSHHVS